MALRICPGFSPSKGGPPDVGSRVDVSLAEDLLRGHVVGRAEHRAGDRQIARVGSLLGELGDAEVEHPDALRAGGEEDIVRLEIPVHDPDVVGRSHRRDHRQQNARRVGQGQRPDSIEPLAEALAHEQVHDHDQAAAAQLHHVVDGHDVGVVDHARRAGLAHEPSAGLLVSGVLPGQELESHGLASHDVGGRPHHRHPTGAELGVEAIAVGD